MISQLCFVTVSMVLVCFGTVSGGFVSCLDAKEVCKRDLTCRTILMYMDISHLCGKSVRECTITDIATCQAAHRTLTSQQVFQNCSCDGEASNFNECHDLYRLLNNHPCLNQGGSIGNPTPLDKYTSTKPQEMSEPASSPKYEGIEKTVILNNAHAHDCNSARTVCLEQPYCSVIYTNFLSKCETRKAGCVSASSESCRQARRYLNSTVLGNCQCYEGMARERKCRRLFQKLYENPCFEEDITPTTESVTLIEYAAAKDSSDLIHAPTGGYNSGESTCIDALTQCNFDDTCRVYLAQYIERCLPDQITGTCRRDDCLTSISAFFATVPTHLTHSLVFCNCQTDDVRCIALREGLNPQCSHEEHPMPYCLDLVSRCNRDDRCRLSYQNFIQQCREDHTSETGCHGSYSACRAAYVGTMGTVIAMSCTCDGDVSRMQQCLEFQQIFFDNQCVGKTTLKAVRTQ